MNQFDPTDFQYGMEMLFTSHSGERRSIARVLINDIARFRGTAAEELRALLFGLLDDPVTLKSEALQKAFVDFVCQYPNAQAAMLDQQIKLKHRARSAKGGSRNAGRRTQINAALGWLIDELGYSHLRVSRQFSALADTLGQSALAGADADDITDLGSVTDNPRITEAFEACHEQFGVEVRHQDGLMLLVSSDSKSLIDRRKLANMR